MKPQAYLASGLPWNLLCKFLFAPITTTTTITTTTAAAAAINIVKCAIGSACIYQPLHTSRM